MDSNTLPQPKYLNLEYIFNWFVELFRHLPDNIRTFLEWLSQFDIRFSSTIISTLLFIGIVFVTYKIILLRRKRRIASYLDFSLEEKSAPEMRSEKWEEIKSHISGDNPIEWKMAIIEADSLLDEIVKNAGYKGENLGERLKSIQPGTFDNLQNIWEAHKIRNQIVHEPGKVNLDKKMAETIIGKYEKALKEFRYL